MRNYLEHPRSTWFERWYERNIGPVFLLGYMLLTFTLAYPMIRWMEESLAIVWFLFLTTAAGVLLFRLFTFVKRRRAERRG